MDTRNIIKYIEENIKNFEYKIFKNISTTGDHIYEEVKKSPILSISKSFDWFISHVIQSDETVYVGSMDRSRNTTNFNIHTDGLYYKDVPEILVLYCMDEWNQKNLTYITDTSKAIESLSKEDISILEQLQYTYIWRDWKHHTRNLIEEDPLTKTKITNISAKGFVAPFPSLWVLMPDLFEANMAVTNLYHALQANIFYIHTWEKWDLLFLNNNKYSHWRTGESIDINRHLLRIWIHIDKTWL